MYLAALFFNKSSNYENIHNSGFYFNAHFVFRL
jgi:hypothetical protein